MYFEVWCSLQPNSLKDFGGSPPPLPISAKKLHLTSNDSITSPAGMLRLHERQTPPHTHRCHSATSSARWNWICHSALLLHAGTGSGMKGVLLLVVTVASRQMPDALSGRLNHFKSLCYTLLHLMQCLAQGIEVACV